MTISKPLLNSIALAFKQKIAMKDIAKSHNVSFKTVGRELQKCAQNNQMNFNHLPETLLIDEFKGTKDTSGSFCFICADGETGKLFEILDDRRNFKLVRYFMRFSREARLNVKRVVMDMNAAYVSFIEQVFPNAIIIIDGFHIIQQLNRTLNITRVKEMNKLNRYKGEEAKQYRKLKKYWKTLLKKNKHLNYTSYKQYPLFQKKYLCESDVIEQILKTSTELRNAYHVYQKLLYTFDERDSTLFFDTIDHFTFRSSRRL